MAAKKKASKTVKRSAAKTRVAARRRATPLYFLTLRIKDIRCFGAEQLLDLSDGKGRPAPWTIILGNNGVGKTTLLQCLALCEPQAMDPFVEKRTGAFPRVALELSRRIGSRRGSWAMLAVGFHKGTLDGHDGDTKSFRMDWDPASKLKRLSGVVFRKDEEHFACHGYGATRRMGAGALSGKVSSLNESLFQEDVPLRNAEEWLLQADYAASKAPAREKFAKANRDRIVQVLLDLLPDIDEITFVAPGPGVPVARVEFRTPYGFVGMRDLSLGYRTLIAWMVDLASRLFERYPESANPLAEPAVVLVDEIDLHLHPAWQRRLMSYLREHFPKTQFIVTAHSPLVVQSAADANIVVLRKEGDHVIIDNNPASVKGWRVDQILTSDLFGLSSARSPQLESLLQKRTQLLSKARLSASDKARVKELDAQIGFLPTGETQNEREALEIIQRFAQRVHKEGV
ncbi:AAA family ATPase [Corallococcus sicarius]|uniref:AAA+ ATPase domain-containing protein n=1 Tax=Corallococcus sicarius TaxID=2316726 RepID=A0A3A8MXP5_9BACT|nr:hypothetical protein D7X12_31115 [Corallococcus sicarius]